MERSEKGLSILHAGENTALISGGYSINSKSLLFCSLVNLAAGFDLVFVVKCYTNRDFNVIKLCVS